MILLIIPVISAPWDIFFPREETFDLVLLADDTLYLINLEYPKVVDIADNVRDYTLLTESGDRLLIARQEKKFLKLKAYDTRHLRWHRSGLKISFDEYLGSYPYVWQDGTGDVFILTKHGIVITDMRCRRKAEVILNSDEEPVDILYTKQFPIVLLKLQERTYKLSKLTKLSYRNYQLFGITQFQVNGSDIYPYILEDDKFLFSLYEPVQDEEGKLKWIIEALSLRGGAIPERLFSLELRGYAEYYRFNMLSYSEGLLLTDGLETVKLNYNKKGTGEKRFESSKFRTFSGELIGLMGKHLILKKASQIIMIDLENGSQFGLQGDWPVILNDHSFIFSRYMNGKLMLFRYDSRRGIAEFMLSIPRLQPPELLLITPLNLK